MSHKEPSQGIIHDRRKRVPFVLVERAILRAAGLSNNAKLLYLFLVDYAGAEGSCFPGQARLAADLAVRSVDTVQRALMELRSFGLVDWQRRGQNKPNVYALLPLEGNRRLDLGMGHKSAAVDTAPMRLPDTASLRYEQDRGEQESGHHHPQSPSSPAGRTAEGATRDDVVELLREAGISPRAALKLSSQYPADRIRRQLSVLAHLRQIKSPLVAKNPPGWLRLAIEENYYPPPEYLQAKGNEERRRKRAAEVARSAQEELRRHAAELSVPPAERAERWLAAWERSRNVLRRPPLAEHERAQRLANITQQFVQEATAFFSAHPELRPRASATPRPLSSPQAHSPPQQPNTAGV